MLAARLLLVVGAQLALVASEIPSPPPPSPEPDLPPAAPSMPPGDPGFSPSPPPRPPGTTAVIKFEIICGYINGFSEPGRRLDEESQDTLSAESITDVIVTYAPGPVSPREVTVRTRPTMRPDPRRALQEPSEDPCDFDYLTEILATSGNQYDLEEFVRSGELAYRLNTDIEEPTMIPEETVENVFVPTPSPLSPPLAPGIAKEIISFDVDCELVDRRVRRLDETPEQDLSEDAVEQVIVENSPCCVSGDDVEVQAVPRGKGKGAGRRLSESDPCDFTYKVEVCATDTTATTDELVEYYESPDFDDDLNDAIIQDVSRSTEVEVTRTLAPSPSPMNPPSPPAPPPFPPPFPPKKVLKFDAQRWDPNRHFLDKH